MNKKSKVKGVLEILLVIGLILIIPLFFAIRSVANSPVAQVTGTAYTATPNVSQASASSPSPVQNNAKEPPACTFPLAQTTTSESAPKNYTFSEPQALSPLDANEGLIQIIDWLPDSQRVLLVEDLQNASSAQQNIDLLNPQTGEVQIYATREQTNEPPAWIPGLNSVIYPETKLLKATQKNGMSVAPYEFDRQLWISRGNPQNAQLLEDARLTENRLSDFSVAVQPGGNEIIYRNDEDKQFSKRNGSLGAQNPIAFDPAQWDYHGQFRGNAKPQYFMTWRPSTSQVFLYTYGIGSFGYTFLFDTNTGQVCELNFGGWAFFGRWSSDGRYLAIVRNQEPTFPTNSTDLAVLDTATGQIYSMEVVPTEIVGRHYVDDIAWAPDNRHLLILAGVTSFPGCAPNCSDDHRLYLVDFVASQVTGVLSSNKFTANNPGTNLAWSPDGSKVLALCPELCLISVQRSGQ
jgi:hypothetical protein